jgi:hypothetical protein
MNPDNFSYSIEQIAEMTTWVNYNGFSGEMCWMCHRTANVLASGGGWICECGNFNDVDHHCFHAAWDNPDLGPSLVTIRSGHALAKQSYAREKYL